MIRTQIYLTRAEHEKLQKLSDEMAVSQSALIREAIDQFLAHQLTQKMTKRDILHAAKGLWADRTDLPDFAQLRKEFDRNSRKE